MITSTYPKYIENGVIWPVFRGPYINYSVRMANFLVKADCDKLQAFCDEQLNDPADGRFRYRPLFSHVIMTIADMNGLVLNQEGQKMGTMDERDFMFWIPTLAMKRVARGFYIPHHIAFFPPYLFVDNPFGMTIGREVYGFPKTMGQFEGPERIQQPDFTLSAITFDPYNTNKPAKTDWLVKVEKMAGSDSTGQATESRIPPTTWRNKEEACDEIVRLLADDECGQIRLRRLDKVIDLFVALFKPDVPLVFLKQIRSTEDSSRACFQSVIEAPVEVTDFHRGGRLHGRYKLSVNDLHDYPIADKLGLQLTHGSQSGLVGFWADVAFIIKRGRVVSSL